MNVNSDVVRSFLVKLGGQYPHSVRLVLLGGSALCLLGSLRPTLDIDYVGDDIIKDELQNTMESIALEMNLDVEAVPIAQFIPFSEGTQIRNLSMGHFGKIEVFVLDPYVIALSKIERGFDTDMEDVIFLIQKGLVHLETLETMLNEALEQAEKYDIDSTAMRSHWKDLLNQS